MENQNQPKQEPMAWPEIKQKSKEILEASSINGIPNLIRTNRLAIRVMWAICLIVSFGICANLIVETLLEYLQFEVVTKIRKINQFPCPFPNVTVCGANIFATNYSLLFLDQFKSVNYSIENSSAFYRNNIYKSLEFFRYVGQSYAISDRVSNSEKQKLGLTIDEMLVSCNFAGTDCSVEDFEWTYANIFLFLSPHFFSRLFSFFQKNKNIN
jgi:hypothetical protein